MNSLRMLDGLVNSTHPFQPHRPGRTFVAMSEALMQSELPFPVRRGKVRDVYDLGDALLIVATDRISAFDCIMPNGIPGKGKILTAISLFWFAKFSTFENHLISSTIDDYPPELREHRGER